MMRNLRFRVIKKNGPIVVGDATLRQLEVDMEILRVIHILRPLYTAKEQPKMVFIQTGTDEDLEMYEEIPESGRVAAEETPEIVRVEIP